jgi:predicted nucleic acid-binding protein
VPDNYLLDTNIVSYWYDDHCKEHAKVLARVQAVCQTDPQTKYVSRLFISVVTLGEIEQGHRSAPAPNASVQAEYMAFVREQCREPLEITKHVAVPYGDLKAWLYDQKKRTKIERAMQLVDPASAKELLADENDIWIAAQAMTFNLVLVTHDSRGHFGELQRQFVTTLQVEDWTQ